MLVVGSSGTHWACRKDTDVKWVCGGGGGSAVVGVWMRARERERGRGRTGNSFFVDGPRT